MGILGQREAIFAQQTSPANQPGIKINIVASRSPGQRGTRFAQRLSDELFDVFGCLTPVEEEAWNPWLKSEIYQGISAR
jgi:hypothetical protein